MKRKETILTSKLVSSNKCVHMVPGKLERKQELGVRIFFVDFWGVPGLDKPKATPFLFSIFPFFLIHNSYFHQELARPIVLTLLCYMFDPHKDICLTHSVKKMKGKCPVCSTYKK